MYGFFRLYKKRFLAITCILQFIITNAQTNLLLNGGFEDVNTCTEYSAECGVEGWFYLKDVKAQMLSNETNTDRFGTNSFGIFYNWLGYTGFTPVIGTILPCSLQKGNRYTFKGVISAMLNPRLILQTGICIKKIFYVPNRNFSKNIRPDIIAAMTRIAGTQFFRFEYSFVADGTEKYLTFGTYIKEDTVGAKKKLYGTQTVSIVLDNFQLLPEDRIETNCPGYFLNKKAIYDYNFRHKKMDYSLYGNGELAIVFTNEDSNNITQIKEPSLSTAQPDTLKLGDVFFDFNKANLKPGAVNLLEKHFTRNNYIILVDSMYVEGHTDSIGSDSRNLQLSLDRCESVRQWLLKNGLLANTEILVHPFGKSRPVATNSTPQGRALNRRVELIIFRKNIK
jgi:outer membrane protein OmpA-like peptidoglycan-associated protein